MPGWLNEALTKRGKTAIFQSYIAPGVPGTSTGGGIMRVCACCLNAIIPDSPKHAEEVRKWGSIRLPDNTPTIFREGFNRVSHQLLEYQFGLQYVYSEGPHSKGRWVMFSGRPIPRGHVYRPRRLKNVT